MLPVGGSGWNGEEGDVEAGVCNSWLIILISYVRFDCEGDTMPRRDSATSGRFRCPRYRVRDVVTR